MGEGSTAPFLKFKLPDIFWKYFPIRPLANLIVKVLKRKFRLFSY